MLQSKVLPYSATPTIFTDPLTTQALKEVETNTVDTFTSPEAFIKALDTLEDDS